MLSAERTEELENYPAGKEIPFFNRKQLFFKYNSGKYLRLPYREEQKFILRLLNNLSTTGYGHHRNIP